MTCGEPIMYRNGLKAPQPTHGSQRYTFTSRRLGEFHLNRKAVFGISAVCFAISISLCCIGISGLRYAERTTHWPSVNGRVIDIQEYEHHNSELGTTYYSYTSTVIYSVDGNSYIKTFDGSHQQPIKVFYDPSAPGDSVLEPGVESDETDLAFLVAVFAGLLGSGTLAIALSPKCG